jgi:hypothetical protein
MDGIKKENDCFIRKHHKWNRVAVVGAGVHLGELENESTAGVQLGDFENESAQFKEASLVGAE